MKNKGIIRRKILRVLKKQEDFNSSLDRTKLNHLSKEILCKFPKNLYSDVTLETVKSMIKGCGNGVLELQGV
jgi:hypothetical protein